MKIQVSVQKIWSQNKYYFYHFLYNWQGLIMIILNCAYFKIT